MPILPYNPMENVKALTVNSSLTFDSNDYKGPVKLLEWVKLAL